MEDERERTPRVPHRPIPEVEPDTVALGMAAANPEKETIVKTRFQVVQDRIAPSAQAAREAIPLMRGMEKESGEAVHLLAGRSYPFIPDKLLDEIKVRFGLVRQWQIGVAQFEGLSHVDIMCGSGGEIEEKMVKPLSAIPETRQMIEQLKRLILVNVVEPDSPEAVYLVAWATPSPDGGAPPAE